MKKIEKLERVKPGQLMGMIGEASPQWVARELNKIIDYLNQSQEKPEEECTYFFPPSLEEICKKCGVKFEYIKHGKQEEGTFNKEELETLKLWGESLKFWELFVSDSDNALREKISKLLKEEE